MDEVHVHPKPLVLLCQKPSGVSEHPLGVPDETRESEPTAAIDIEKSLTVILTILIEHNA
jgi:hypothetical protein